MNTIRGTLLRGARAHIKYVTPGGDEKDYVGVNEGWGGRPEGERGMSREGMTHEMTSYSPGLAETASGEQNR